LTERIARVAISVRPYAQGDRALVLDTWLRSYYAHARASLTWLAPSTFAVLYRPRVERLLRYSYTRVACLASDEDAIVGWACVANDVIHYVWVRSDWRGEQIARDLLSDLLGEPMRYTHETDLGARWLARQRDVVPWRYDAHTLGKDL
jgi:GNAT superfamily N-acetyltransferase